MNNKESRTNLQSKDSSYFHCKGNSIFFLTHQSREDFVFESRLHLHNRLKNFSKRLNQNIFFFKKQIQKIVRIYSLIQIYICESISIDVQFETFVLTISFTESQNSNQICPGTIENVTFPCRGVSRGDDKQHCQFSFVSSSHKTYGLCILLLLYMNGFLTHQLKSFQLLCLKIFSQSSSSVVHTCLKLMIISFLYIYKTNDHLHL